MSHDAIQKNGAEFISLSGTRPLRDALYVSGPYKVENAPNAYSFERPNLIHIDWSKVLEAADIPVDKKNSDQLKEYVEGNWSDGAGGTPTDSIIKENVFDLDPEWPAFVPDATTLENAVHTQDNHLTIFRGSLKSYRKIPFAEKSISIVTGAAFRIKTRDDRHDRWYQPVINDSSGKSYPGVAEFIGGNWDQTWSRVTALVQVYFPGKREGPVSGINSELASKESKLAFPAIELIRADAAIIARQYKTLMNEEELERALSNKASEIAKLIPAAQMDAISTLAAQYRELKSFGTDLDAKKRQLADAAADLNYQLFIADTEVTYYENGTGHPVTKVLKEGQLYVKSNRTISWNTYQTVTRSDSGFFGIGAHSESWQVPIRHSKTFDYYEEAIVDYDPWVEVLDLYKSNGYNTFLFQYTEKGLVAADGETPSDILKLCEASENFRERCLIAIPCKEVTLIGQSFVVGYYLFIRPVPDIVVTKFPELCIQEHLSYRFTWEGVALGDLAATIPLGPGEQREVTLTTTQRYESSRTETATSLIDITHIDRSDFETIFEREVRKENESSSTVGGSIGGSYAGISGSANFSKKSSTKDVARQLNRSVQRASQEVNRRSKEKRTITISEKVETTAQNTTTFRVRNINDGSTLNIAFYRLYNAFKSLLKLDDFKYTIRCGRSVFAGLDLVDQMVFDRDQMSELVDWLRAPGHFPVDIYDLSRVQLVKFTAELNSQILEAYKKYPHKSKGSQSNDANNSPSTPSPTGARARQIEDILAKLKSIIGETVHDGISPRDLEKRLMAALADTAKVGDELVDLCFFGEMTEFANDSGGLYADVYVGQRPATEPYAENMRRLEEQKVANENRLIASRARYLDARSSKQLIGLGGIIDPKKAYVTERDVLYMEDGHVEVKLRLVPGALWDEGWTIIIKTSPALEGGRFLQQDLGVGGILTFILPRRFNKDGVDIASKDQIWFKDNVTVENVDFGLVLSYRGP